MPRHPVLQALLKDHGEIFLNTELEQRIEANVPPHGKFISLILSGRKAVSYTHLTLPTKA